MISDRDKKLFPYILPTVIFISVFIGCVALGPYLFNADGDLGRHLTLGKYILDTSQIPLKDIFSNSMLGQPLSPHEWLAAVLFRIFYDWFGLTGVVLFTSAILGVVFWLITNQIYQITRSSTITLILVVVGIAGSRIHWLARPHIFTFLFLFLWIQALNNKYSFWKKWLICVVIMATWVNTHGAFVTGYVYVGILILGAFVDIFRMKEKIFHIQQIKEYLGILITSLVLSLVNPSGQAIWQTIIGFLSSRYLVNHTVEYMPPVLYQTGVIPFSLLVIISLVAIIFRYKWMKTAEILSLVFFAGFGLMSGRNIPLFILVSLPILAKQAIEKFPQLRMKLDDHYSFLEAERKPQSVWVNIRWIVSTVGIVFVLGAAVFKLIPALSERNQYDLTKFPVQATDWWIEHPQSGNTFNEFGWGGYLLYRLWPDELVFIDGQTDFYGEKLTRDYEALSNTFPGWERLLQKYEIRNTITPTHSPLAQALARQPDWSVIYSDPTTVIMQKGD